VGMIPPHGTPPARKGGRFLYCPMVDVAATEVADPSLSWDHPVMCDLPRRKDSARGRRALRRHARRDHIGPAMDVSDSLLWFVTNGSHFGFPGTVIQGRAMKGKYRDLEED
jgi:hypothetical protein